jgi:nicotinamidase-related amidase
MPHVSLADCVLVVIDAQPGFYGPERGDVDRAQHGSALARSAWLCSVATALEVPIVITEEDASSNGATAEPILAVVPDGTPRIDKAVFGADDNPDIDAAVRSHGRGTVVLVGTETDVCVAHSAIGWASAGHRCVVVTDAVYSAGEGHGHGLSRLRDEGIELLSCKELYYEWLRSLAAVRAFESAHPELATPPGFHL